MSARHRRTAVTAALLAASIATACGQPGGTGEDAASSRPQRRPTSTTEPAVTTLPIPPSTATAPPATLPPTTIRTPPTVPALPKPTSTTTRPSRPRTTATCPAPEPTTSVTGLPGDGAHYYAQQPAPLPVAKGAWLPMSRGPLAARSTAVAAWTGTEVLVTGGLIKYDAATDSAAYNPMTNTWRPLAARPEPTHAVRDGAWTGHELVVLSTPRQQLGDTAPTAGAAYDPATDRWRAIAPPPTEITGPRTLPFMTAWTGSRLVLYVMTSQEGKPATGRAALYDPATDQWALLPPVAPSMADGRAFIVDGTLAVLGLCSDPDGPSPRVFLYDQAAGAWQASPPAPQRISGYPQVDPLWTGTEMFIGQRDPQQPGVAYDPATNDWRTVSAPTYAGTYQEPQPLPYGRAALYINDPISPIGVYDQRAGTWATAGMPPGPAPSGGNLVSTEQALIWWGPDGSGNYPDYDKPSAAWTWLPG